MCGEARIYMMSAMTGFVVQSQFCNRTGGRGNRARVQHCPEMSARARLTHSVAPTVMETKTGTFSAFRLSPMLLEPAASRESSGNVRPGFEDGLGRRYRPAARLESDAPLEILCFRHEITDVPSFEFALRERVARFSDLHHPAFTRIRKVDRLNDEHGTVVLMSDGAAGVRLIDILAEVERSGRVLDVNAALSLVRQLISAVAALHRHARVAHGAIAPERMYVTPRGRLFLVEYALGAALEQLKYSRERYWKELRVALPMNVGLPRFDERADLTQIGVVALSLMTGRAFGDDEYPRQIEALVAGVRARAVDGNQEALSPALVEWLRRALQLDVRSSFRTIFDAEAALDQLLSQETKYNASPGSLEAFMQRYHEPAAPVAPKAPVAPAATLTPAAATKPVSQPALPSIAFDTTPEADLRPAVEPYEPIPIDPADTSDEGSQAFDEQQEDAMRPAHTAARKPNRLKWIVAAMAVIAATAAGALAARQRLATVTPPVTTGKMTVNTDPPGAEVEVDGEKRGRSPLSLSLAAGAHTVVVRANGQSKTVPITIAAGADVSQYFDLPKAGSGFGQLQVRTEPAGARISIDGTPLGKTPMTIIEIVPGEHSVTLESDLGTVTQKVTIEAGVQASLMVPLGPQAGTVASGWITVTSPLEVELRENGRLLGTSGIDRIMLAVGKHDIELVNDLVGYKEMRTVQVAPGRVTALNIAIPKGSVSLNAVPWATVTIDGENVGDTPIGNLPLAVGQHEVVFRNTELGEQRRIITVTLRTPTRLSVDMTRK